MWIWKPLRINPGCSEFPSDDSRLRCTIYLCQNSETAALLGDFGFLLSSSPTIGRWWSRYKAMIRQRCFRNPDQGLVGRWWDGKWKQSFYIAAWKQDGSMAPWLDKKQNTDAGTNAVEPLAMAHAARTVIGRCVNRRVLYTRCCVCRVRTVNKYSVPKSVQRVGWRWFWYRSQRIMLWEEAATLDLTTEWFLQYYMKCVSVLILFLYYSSIIPLLFWASFHGQILMLEKYL